MAMALLRPLLKREKSKEDKRVPGKKQGYEGYP
jgi:hypothetical protein